MTKAISQPDYLVVGEILRPHGIRGELRVRMITDYPEHLRTLKFVYLGDSPEDYAFTRIPLNGLRFNKNFALLSLDGYKSRDDADLLRGKLVLIDMAQAKPLGDGQYYLFQLVGMKVIADGAEIGRVKEVLQTGANDVYVVESDRYGDVLIPAHEQTIEGINFGDETINMSLPDGLLPAD